MNSQPIPGGHKYEVGVVGVTFTDDRQLLTRQEVIRMCTLDSRVELVREPDNKFDKNAIVVYVDVHVNREFTNEDGSTVVRGDIMQYRAGYIPRALALVLTNRMIMGYTTKASILRKGSFSPSDGDTPVAYMELVITSTKGVDGSVR